MPAENPSPASGPDGRITPARNRAFRARGWRALAIVAAYGLATLVMTWPYVNYAEFATASYGGDARLIIWTLAWDNHALLTGTPFFQANVFYPAAESLRYNEHLFALSLFTLPWAAAGASPVLAYNVTWWLAFLLNGLTSFALVRRFAADRLAAFAGSLAFTYSFYVMLHAHGHLALIWLWPLPASLLLLERWFDKPAAWRMMAWLMVVLAQALTSWYLAVIIAVANGVMAVVLLLGARARPTAAGSAPASTRYSRSRLVHATAAAVLGAACVYPFARQYVGMRSSPEEAALYAADVEAYLVPPENTMVGRWWEARVDDRPRSIWGEQTLFAGWTALALAALGVGALVTDRSISRRAWVLPALVVTGFLISLGPSPALLGGPALAPFAWMTALPGFDGMRVPARFGVLVMLGLAGLAGIGAAAAGRRFGRRGRLVVAAAIPLMLAESFVVDFPAGKPAPQPIPAIYRTPELREARSLVSIPDYSGTPEWFLGADYLYYSTVHWRPIVNGFGRTEPPGHQAVLAHVRAFPGDADGLRRLGIQYVVVHAERLADGGRRLIAAAQASRDYRLAAHIGSQYLFEVIGR